MPYPKTPEDVAAKNDIMNAFFDDALKRVEYLIELNRNDHQLEALTLALTYVDSFAQWLLSPSQKDAGRKFVEALSAFETAPYFALVHPLQAIRAFSRMNGFWPSFAQRLANVFHRPDYELLDQPSFEAAVASHFSATEVQQIRGELWRSTMGGIAYYWLRNPSVHRFGASPHLSFGGTTLNGNEAPDMTLESFLPVLRAMIEEARKRSLAACQWFGDDRIVLDA